MSVSLINPITIPCSRSDNVPCAFEPSQIHPSLTPRMHSSPFSRQDSARVSLCIPPIPLPPHISPMSLTRPFTISQLVQSSRLSRSVSRLSDLMPFLFLCPVAAVQAEEQLYLYISEVKKQSQEGPDKIGSEDKRKEGKNRENNN